MRLFTGRANLLLDEQCSWHRREKKPVATMSGAIRRLYRKLAPRPSCAVKQALMRPNESVAVIQLTSMVFKKKGTTAQGRQVLCSVDTMDAPLACLSCGHASPARARGIMHAVTLYRPGQYLNFPTSPIADLNRRGRHSLQ
ncbi:MAG TPA: hypothetical protein VJ654_00755 [Noviherbaspirillum sp.]|nr:hypothetical protein [Noviherbaspirillum sp.]